MKLLLTIFLTICSLATFATPSKEVKTTSSSKEASAKYLAKETSPYLLNYVNSSINWYPWHEAAFKKAEKENKMIIVDFGQLACDECFLNDKNVFENKAVAKTINDHFIAIKVDINQRPDLYKLFIQIYKAHTKETGSNSLTAITLPNGKPFWVEDELKQFHLTRAMNFFMKHYYKNPVKMEFVANQLLNKVKSNVNLTVDAPIFKERSLRYVGDKLTNAVDFQKHNIDKDISPLSSSFKFLLRHYYNTQNPKVLETIKGALDKLAMSETYDHIDGGFYGVVQSKNGSTTDLSKSIYTNGQLISLYSEAYQLTKNPLYKKVVTETIAFIENKLSNNNGSFYSGIQGKNSNDSYFNLWTAQEVSNSIQNEMFTKVFNEYYNIKATGQIEGKNLLYRTKTDEEIMANYGLEASELASIIELGIEKLQKNRNSRVKPQVDNQIVASYNAIIVKAYVDAYKAIGTPAYLNKAISTADFIKDNFIEKSNRLTHNYARSKSNQKGFLDDYAHTIDALINLYQVSFDEEWLYQAQKLGEYTIENFKNQETGMFQYSNQTETIVSVENALFIDIEDNFLPSSNSIMAQSLFILGQYFDNNTYKNISKSMLANVQKSMETSKEPTLFANWGIVYNYLVEEPYEVTIVGTDYEKLRTQISNNFLPNALFFGGNSAGTLSSMEGKFIEGETLIYVCKNKICKMPTSEVTQALALLEDKE